MLSVDMPKIIVHNDSSASDIAALQMVTAVIRHGRELGGDGSYRHRSTFYLKSAGHVGVAAIRRNPMADEFYLVDELNTERTAG